MRPLDDQSIARRFITTFIIVVIILLLLAFIGWISGDWERDAEERGYGLASAEESRPELCVPTAEIREEIRIIMQHGLDDALRDAVLGKYAVWMRDTTDQPRRARLGIELAVAAYLKARKGMDDWNPPLCKSN